MIYILMPKWYQLQKMQLQGLRLGSELNPRPWDLETWVRVLYIYIGGNAGEL